MIPLSCAIVAVTACAAADAVSPERISAIADAVRTWPEYYDAAELPDTDKASIDAVFALPSDALDILVASDNPRHRALAVQLANCRGDLERLRSWKHLLIDNIRGIAESGYSASGPSSNTDERRQARYLIAQPPPFVSGVYRAAMATWFGQVPPEYRSMSDEEFPVSALTDLDQLVQP